MNNKMPDSITSFSLLQAKTEATDTVTRLLERNIELEEIYDALQPLLYYMSVKLYGDNDEKIPLAKLIEDGVTYLKGSEGENLQ